MASYKVGGAARALVALVVVAVLLGEHTTRAVEIPDLPFIPDKWLDWLESMKWDELPWIVRMFFNQLFIGYTPDNCVRRCLEDVIPRTPKWTSRARMVHCAHKCPLLDSWYTSPFPPLPSRRPAAAKGNSNTKK